MIPKRLLSTVVEDYLRAIYSVGEWDEGGVGVSDLAHLMGVVPSTASENVRKLREAGLVDHEPYGRVRLTEEGRRHAVEMVRRHRILETFLNQFLGFSWDEVHEEAEELEHAVSDRFIDRLEQALGYPDTDPHGDPIPSKEGVVADSEDLTLMNIPVQMSAQVMRIRDAEPAVLRHFEARGVVPGAQVQVVDRSEATGMITLQVADATVDLPERLGQCVRVQRLTS